MESKKNEYANMDELRKRFDELTTLLGDKLKMEEIFKHWDNISVDTNLVDKVAFLEGDIYNLENELGDIEKERDNLLEEVSSLENRLDDIEE